MFGCQSGDLNFITLNNLPVGDLNDTARYLAQEYTSILSLDIPLKPHKAFLDEIV